VTLPLVESITLKVHNLNMVPDYETLMLPILKILADGETWRTREIVLRVGEEFQLSEDEMREMIPNGRARLIQNRVGWASTYLRKAGLIQSVRHGHNRQPRHPG